MFTLTIIIHHTNENTATIKICNTLSQWQILYKLTFVYNDKRTPVITGVLWLKSKYPTKLFIVRRHTSPDENQWQYGCGRRSNTDNDFRMHSHHYMHS